MKNKYLFIIFTIFLFVQTNLYSQDKKKAEWLFIYYMPYDNNLTEHGDTIINMLKSGLISDDIIVTIQADFSDTLGFYRYTLTNTKTEKINIKYEYSASTKSFEDYMNWIDSNFNANNYCLIFLNHGGGLDGLCYDEYPDNQFLKIDSISEIILDFNKRIDKKIELIFLQVCAKGSIEAIYELKDCSNYTMYSQLVMGAPNYYYENTLKYVFNNQNTNGDEIARQIVKNESLSMYNSYSCIDNSKMDSMAYYFNDFINSVNEIKRIEIYDSLLVKSGYPRKVGRFVS